MTTLGKGYFSEREIWEIWEISKRLFPSHGRLGLIHISSLIIITLLTGE